MRKQNVVQIRKKTPGLAIKIAEARGAVKWLQSMHYDALDYVNISERQKSAAEANLEQAKRLLADAWRDLAERNTHEFYVGANLGNAQEELTELVEAARKEAA